MFGCISHGSLKSPDRAVMFFITTTSENVIWEPRTELNLNGGLKILHLVFDSFLLLIAYSKQ